MGWFSSIVIGLITAALGCVGAGFVATKCVRWYRISSFEGGAGYYVVGIALLGIVAGLVLGIVCARVVAGWDMPAFSKGLGLATASMGGLVLVVGLVAWIGADLAPTIAGNDVELQVEVRAPKGFTVPEPEKQFGAFAAVYIPGGRSQPQAELKLKEAELVEDRWTVTAGVPLDTSVSTKYLRVYFNEANDLMFALSIPRSLLKPGSGWSAWVDSGWNVGQAQPAPEARFNMRFKVTEVLPPPPGPTQAEVDARNAAEESARFEAIPPSAPLTTWLPYTRYGAREDWRGVAIGHMLAREKFVEELATLMIADDQAVAADAMRVVEHLPQPFPALNGAVTTAGRRLAEFIRKKNATTVQEDESFLWAAEASVRFSSWMVAVRSLREKSGGDFTPELREILELSRVRTDSHCMQADVRRVASYYMHQWTGQEPVPGDPKPR